MRIGILGTLAVQDDAGRPVRVGGARVRALLILLALDAGRVVPAYALIDQLWGERDSRPSDAVNALQSLVSRLRAALRDGGIDPGAIESSPAGYRLAVRPGDVDAIAFEERARAGARELAHGSPARAARILREALAAWRGPALADVAGEEFAAAAAARLTEARFTALLDRIEADLALGDGSAVAGELRAITTADPLAERPRALLMRALAADGRQAEAIAAYHELRDHLAGELGVDPSPSLEQVYLAILRQESVPGRRAAPRARALTSFVGRDDDTSGVLKKLEEHRLVTLTGPGGVGKTRLATEVLARAGGTAWLAELAPVTDPAQLPYAVLSAAGVVDRVIARQGPDAGSPLDRLADSLSGQQAILVLDNCEHVIDAAAALAARVLDDCPKVTVLATSREPLRIAGEALWPVAPLRVPPAGEVLAARTARGRPEPIACYPAVRMLADRGAAVLPGFAVDDENAAAVARLCRALDGMPLAIELAAPWLRTLTPQQLAERLDDRFAILTGGSRAALPRHQTLRAVVDWSWDLLSDAEQALARRLAVFPSGATLAAVEAVCADEASRAGAVLPRAMVLPALDGLVGKSILSAVDAADVPPGGPAEPLPGPAGTGPRYRMLETVRAYGLEKLTRAGEQDRVKAAFIRYYADLAETADERLRTDQQVPWCRLLVAEQDNVHAALREATGRGDAESGLRLVRGMSFYWVQLGHGEGDALARAVLALGLPRAQTLRIAEAKVICALVAAGWSWEVEMVRGPLTEALADLSRWSGDYATFHPLAALAEPMMALYDGDQPRALAMFERYLTVPDPWMRAVSRLYRASSTSTFGTMDGVEEDCRAALEEFRAIGDKWGRAITLAQLAEYIELQGDHDASLAMLEEAGDLGRELGAWGDLPYIGGRLATVRARAGDLARAWQEWSQAERAAVARGGYGEAARWLGFMRAEIAWRAGDLAEVARCCTEVLDAIRGQRATWWEGMRAQAKARLAMVALAQSDKERARRLLHEALAAATGWVERPPVAAVIDACAAYVLASDPEAAATLLGAAHAVRGAFDEGSPDAPGVRAAAREALAAGSFDAAYQRGRDLGYDRAVARAREVLGPSPG